MFLGVEQFCCLTSVTEVEKESQSPRKLLMSMFYRCKSCDI